MSNKHVRQTDMDIQSSQHLFSEYSTYLLTTHLNPDGDGLGSQLALFEYLISMNKSVRCINESPTPRNYAFLDPAGKMIEIYNPSVHDDVIREIECIIVIDTNEPTRLGGMEKAVRESKAVKIVIDHHLDKNDFADHYIVDVNASAAGEIVYKVLKALTGGAFTKSMAVNLYTAIMTDTGSFRFPKTNSETHLITADLLDCGALPAEIYREIYERGPVNRLLLLGKALTSLKLHHGGRVAVMKITDGMFTETGTNITETDGFVNFAMQIDNVEMGILFTESEGSVKISFRARGDIWVNKLAKEFGGNGHQHAAGATVSGRDIDTLITQAIEKSPNFLP